MLTPVEWFCLKCEFCNVFTALFDICTNASYLLLFRKLDCGNHECKEICHASNCRGCELQPDVVVFCPCGKMRIVELLNGEKRNSCLDSIPCCGNTCDGFLPCAKYNGMYCTHIKNTKFNLRICTINSTVFF